MKKHIKDENMEFNYNFSEVDYSPNNLFSEVEHRLELDTSYECKEDPVKNFIIQLGYYDV